MDENPARAARLFFAVWSCHDCDVSWLSARCEPCWMCGKPGRNGVPMSMFITSNAYYYHAADWEEGMVA